MRAVAVALATAAAGAFAQDAPITTFPYTPGLDVSSMDRTADPCSDFYQYACGGWLRNNPIPPDQSSWSVYGKLYQDNQRFLWGILDSLAKATEGRNATQQKIGDYFAACMDEAAVERLGARPLAPYLARIDGMKDKRELGALLGELHLDTGDRGLFFGIGSNQDFEKSTSVIAFVAAGGLGLPDRDYYTREDARSQEIRAKYVAHVTRVFQLLGDGAEAAARNATTVMEMETALAKASLTRVEKRDPYNLFHKLDGKAVRGLTPAFDWDGYLGPLGLEGVDTFNVTEPGFFKAFDREIESRSLADIRTYLRWHMAKQSSAFLSTAFVNENFDFFGRTLRGVPELRPRWKRCVTLVDEQLGEALGQEFVARAFSPKLKDDTVRMTRRIEQAMRDDIRSLTWMSDATKKRALEKLDTIVNKIGYPDKWRDYSSVDVRRDDFFGNVQRAQRFESKRELAKIGEPLDRGEWHMSPPTVNAYYDAQLNDINFPAGVLQPPLYDPKMDDAPNYGDTGGTIGHELTHGFDDQGRKFDAQGNLSDWWSAQDAKAFTERAQCIVDQYAQYVIVDDIKINSQLTLGEDVADIGGLVLAWMAWKAEVADKKPGDRDELDPEQRFFVGYAQWACENQRPENLRVKALTDPHSPGKYRVNGLMVNMPEFAKAFSCKPGSPMVSENRCRVW